MGSLTGMLLTSADQRLASDVIFELLCVANFMTNWGLSKALLSYMGIAKLME